MKKRRRGTPNLERSLRRTLEPLEKMKIEEWSLELGEEKNTWEQEGRKHSAKRGKK